MRALLAPLCGAVLVALALPAWSADNQLGVNVHVPAADVVELVEELGTGWMRVDNNWKQSAAPCSDDIVFPSALDLAVAEAADRGISVYMTLAYGPACASTGDSDGNSNNDVPDASLYANFVRQAVAHYRTMGVTHYGLWNEADLDGFWEGSADQYVDHVILPGLPAVQDGCTDAGYSDCKALGPELAHVGDYDVFMEQTLNRMNAAGVMFDILSHHIYQGFDTPIYAGDSFKNALEERRFSFTRRSMMDVLEDTGLAVDGVPVLDVWITETGNRAEPPTGSAAMADQSDYLQSVVDFQIDRDWWTNSFFYEILDCGTGCSIDGFGITRRNADDSFLLKPAYLDLQDRIATDPAFAPECSDGQDNDGDGDIDLADLGCASADDDDESDEAYLVAAAATGVIQIDGSLDEWSSATWATIAAPADYVIVLEPAVDAADASARLAVQWHADSLALAIEVTDDAHSNDEPPGTTWAGDSVQLAFDVAGNGGTTYDDTDDYELTLALASGAPRAEWTHVPSGAAPALPPLAVTRNGNTTRYELEIPPADLGVSAWAEGRVLRATFLVNDNDGAGRAGWLEWTPGIGAGKTPESFGWIELAAAGPGPTPTPSPTPTPGDGGNNDGSGAPTGCACATAPVPPASPGVILLVGLLAAVVAMRRRPKG